MADIVQEMAEHAAAELGLTVNTDTFYGHYPDIDADPSCAFLLVGGPPERLDRAWEDWLISVTVKGGYTLGRQLAEDIYELYHGGSNWSLPTWEVAYSEAQSKPQQLGRDEKNREQFTFQLLLSARPA